MLYTPIKSIGNKYIDIQKAFLAIERVFEMINFKPEIKSAQEAVKIDGIKESVEFDDVVFEYKPGLPVLKHVSLKVPIGKTMLIGNTNQMPGSIYDTGNSMASIVANQFGEADGLKLSSLFAIALLLFAITAIINIIGKIIIRRNSVKK